jgi:anion-transporting  ArsA/GET3 family ATPase
VLVELLSKQKRAEKALARAVNSLSSLETYLSSVKVDHLEVTKLREVVEQYDSTAGDLDEKITVLEKELKETAEAIKKEKSRLAGPTGNEKLNLKATIGVFADKEGDINITLIYGTWYEPPQYSKIFNGIFSRQLRNMERWL